MVPEHKSQPKNARHPARPQGYSTTEAGRRSSFLRKRNNAALDDSMARFRAYDAAKRIIDLLVSIAAALVFGPVALLAAAILWCMQGRVLFRQLRPGLYGKPFLLYKFCTMTDERDARGELLPDSRRITAIGRIVRSLSIDELPQLWNVIRGDMSLVGPRPLLMEYLPRYSQVQARRHDVRPGITGWVQVNGRNSLNWAEKFQLDVWYVEHRSFFLDLKILALTVARVAQRHGISNQEHATMPEFLGNPQEHSPCGDAFLGPPHSEVPEIR
jgi:sugar transferase EpsL